MVIRNGATTNIHRVTVALRPEDVDLLDRLGALEGRNRSEELRSILEQLRPMLRQTVETFEAALRQREAFDEVAARVALSDLEALLPEAEELGRRYLGAVSRIEGKQAAASDSDPRPSNTGVTPLPPTSPEDED